MINSKSDSLFIVIEGLDGSGKTTTAKQLAKKLNASFISTSCKKTKEKVNDIKKYSAHYEEVCHFLYLEKVRKASVKAQRILAMGRPVVMDRYIWSTNTYAKARGSKLKINLDKYYLKMPDLLVNLLLPTDEREKRIAYRSDSDVDDRRTLDPDFEKKLLLGFKKSMQRITPKNRIDIKTDKSTVEIVNEILYELRQRVKVLSPSFQPEAVK